jgi:tRNA(Ile)-lysidine synthetase-like protein
LKKGENRWGKWIIRFEDKPRGERGASANGKTGVWVRSWKQGDRFRPAGLGGTKKLQDFFTDSKIPRQKRDSIPIFTDKNGEILAVGNLRVAEGSHWMKGAVKLERIKKPEIDEVT